MARDFGPFPTKPMYEVVNRRMQRAFRSGIGFVQLPTSGQGAVTAGTGAQLVIAAYPDGALIDGLYVENPASETVTLTTNTGSTNPRIDRLVMRLDMGAQTIAPFQIVGTPAASPQTPPLVNTGAIVDMPLCRYTMPGSASAQNPGGIIDERPTVYSGAVVAELRQTATQSIPTNSWTALNFDTEDIDLGNCHNSGSPSRWTAPAPCVVQVTGAYGWALINGNTADTPRGVRIHKNGSPVQSSTITDLWNNDRTAYISTKPANVQLAPGDYLQVGAYQNSGAPLNTALPVVGDFGCSMSVNVLGWL